MRRMEVFFIWHSHGFNKSTFTHLPRSKAERSLMIAVVLPVFHDLRAWASICKNELPVLGFM